MRELYALIVGEAGLSPEYFLTRMSPDEAADFLEGYHRRGREAWERARIGWFMQVGDSDGKDVKEKFPLAWDEKKKPKTASKKQREALRRRAEAIAQSLKMTNGKKQ